MPHFNAKAITPSERAKMTLRSQPAHSGARGIVTKTRLGVRTAVLFVFALFLAWLVITQSFAAYFAEVAPETALWLHPGQPLALDNLADRTLDLRQDLHPLGQGASDHMSERGENASAEQSGSSEKPESVSSTTDDSTHPAVLPEATVNEVRAWATSSLMNNPLNARALRILGQLAAVNKNYDAASKLLNAAAQLSLHETIAVYGTMLAAAEAKDYKTTTYYADVLLRTRPELDKYVVPILTKIVEDKGSGGLVEAVVDKNPPWRKRFFDALPHSVEDARTPLDLFLQLRTSSMPPTSGEIAPYVEFLLGRKLYDLAYYTWLQFLPVDELREAGLLFNGNFDVVPSGLPFDWVIRSGAGVTLEIVPKPDSNGKHALLVDFAYGRVDYHSVRQLVMLAPGTYEFKGQYKGQLLGPRGLKWRIVCASGPRIEESPMIIGMMPSWKTIAFTFTVPAEGCRAQYVQLDLDARMASEQLVSGSMMFDELQISRVANPS
jgi:hypothetical protein